MSWNFITFSLFICLVSSVCCVTLEQSKQFVSQMLNHYDVRQRPVLDQTKPVYVSCTFILKVIHEYDEVEGRLRIKGTLVMEWKDESLFWDAASFGNLTSFPFPLEDIWYPKLKLVNSFDEGKTVGEKWMDIRVTNTGLARLYGSDNFEVCCESDVTMYPFDTQRCSLVFIAYSNTGDEVRLQPGKLLEKNKFLSQTHENRVWILRNVSSRAAREQTRSDMFVVNIVIERRPGFLLVNMFLPVMFLSCMNILVFMLPAESGERTSFAVTVLLAMSFYMTVLENTLPEISQPMPWICYYLLFFMLQSGIVCIITILNLRLFFESPSAKVPKWLHCCTNRTWSKTKSNGEIGEMDGTKRNKQPFENKGAKDEMEQTTIGSKNEVTWQDVSKTVDVIVFIFLLVATIVCNLVYFTSSLMNVDSISRETKINAMFL